MIVRGIVERGKQLGRTLGFPTANIAPMDAEGAWPGNGVYVAAAWFDGEAAARLCMLNQGVHPTVPEGKPTIEAHVLGFAGDLYGKRARVEYLHFLRPERRFSGVEALRAQLERDRADTAAWLEDALAAPSPDAEQLRARELTWAKR